MAIPLSTLRGFIYAFLPELQRLHLLTANCVQADTFFAAKSIKAAALDCHDCGGWVEIRVKGDSLLYAVILKAGNSGILHKDSEERMVNVVAGQLGKKPQELLLLSAG